MQRALFALLTPALAAGCYTYRPLNTSAPPAGGLLRVTLTDEGTSRLTAQVGPNVTAIDGRLARAAAPGEPLLLSVAVTTRRDGVEQDWKGERVEVPRDAVSSLRERRFSRPRTIAAAGGLIALVAAGIVALGSGGEGGGVGGGTTPVGQ